MFPVSNKIKQLNSFRGHPLSTYYAKFSERTCPCQGVKNVSFSEIFAYVLKGLPLMQNTIEFEKILGGQCLQNKPSCLIPIVDMLHFHWFRPSDINKKFLINSNFWF